jgi:Negative regulator of sigma F
MINTAELINKLAKETTPCKRVTYKNLITIWFIGVILFSLYNLFNTEWSSAITISRLIEASLIYLLGVLVGVLVIRLGFPDLNLNDQLIKLIMIFICTILIVIFLFSYLLGGASNKGSVFYSGNDLWNSCVCSVEVSTLATIPSFLLIALVRKAAPMNSIITVTLSFISGGLLAISFFHLCNPLISLYSELFFSLLPISLIVIICFKISDYLIESWSSRISQKQKNYDC